MNVTMILADDNFGTRSALELVLGKRLAVQVAGDAASFQELRALAGQIAADLLILDWELPGFKGAASLKELRAWWPGVKVVALSARPEARTAALAAGADAFVSKVEQPEVLLQVVRTCCQCICDRAANPSQG